MKEKTSSDPANLHWDAKTNIFSAVEHHLFRFRVSGRKMELSFYKWGEDPEVAERTQSHIFVSNKKEQILSDWSG